MGSSMFRKASSICCILSPSVTATESTGYVRPSLEESKAQVETIQTVSSCKLYGSVKVHMGHGSVQSR